MNIASQAVNASPIGTKRGAARAPILARSSLARVRNGSAMLSCCLTMPTSGPSVAGAGTPFSTLAGRYLKDRSFPHCSPPDARLEIEDIARR